MKIILGALHPRVFLPKVVWGGFFLERALEGAAGFYLDFLGQTTRPLNGVFPGEDFWFPPVCPN